MGIHPLRVAEGYEMAAKVCWLAGWLVVWLLARPLAWGSRQQLP